MLAVAGAPGAVSLEATALVEFRCSPTSVPVTVRLMLQLAPAASEPPVSAIMLPPAEAPMFPLQSVDNPEGEPIARPDGSASVKARPVRDMFPFGFRSVNVSDVLLPGPIFTAPNDL